MVNKTERPIAEIVMLCDDRYIGEKREIGGVTYNVVDWGKITPARITNELRRKIAAEFALERFKGTPPKMYFVCDYTRRMFVFGLWDDAASSPAGTHVDDYSYIFDLFFPNKM